MMCDGPSTRIVGIYLPTQTGLLTFGVFCVNNNNNNKKKPTKRAVVKEMWKQNIQEMEVWESTFKQQKILLATIEEQTSGVGTHLEMQTLAFLVNL